MKHAGCVFRYTDGLSVTVWQVRWRLRRRWRIGCDLCGLWSGRYRSSDQAWRQAQRHADWHNTPLGVGE